MNKTEINFEINGQPQTSKAYPMARLLDIIREDANLTGTKEGCGEGECGACSIFLDGKLVNSCLVPALQANNKRIETVESLASEQTLSKIQQAFLEHGGAQCGICTPGMLMAATELLKKKTLHLMKLISEKHSQAAYVAVPVTLKFSQVSSKH